VIAPRFLAPVPSPPLSKHEVVLSHDRTTLSSYLRGFSSAPLVSDFDSEA
jgi:hypothetical protein